MLLNPPTPVHVARIADSIPAGPRWSYEPKFDGWRAILFRAEQNAVRIQSRAGNLITRNFPDLAEAALSLPPATVLDGELVVWHGGRVSFAAVQRRALAAPRRAAHLAHTLPASYAAFDLLEHAGEDWRHRPYRTRRAALVELLADVEPPIQLVPATTDREVAERWWWDLRDIGIEGLVVKHLDGTYRGPSAARGWWKVKHGEPRR